MKAKLTLCQKCEHFKETGDRNWITLRAGGKICYSCNLHENKITAVTKEDYTDYNVMYDVVPDCPYILEQSLL